MSRHGGLVTWLADQVMPWAARHASVWPSQHSVCAGLTNTIRSLYGENEILWAMLLERGMTEKHIDQEIARRKG